MLTTMCTHTHTHTKCSSKLALVFIHIAEQRLGVTGADGAVKQAVRQNVNLGKPELSEVFLEN